MGRPRMIPNVWLVASLNPESVKVRVLSGTLPHRSATACDMSVCVDPESKSALKRSPSILIQPYTGVAIETRVSPVCGVAGVFLHSSSIARDFSVAQIQSIVGLRELILHATSMKSQIVLVVAGVPLRG